MASIVRGLVSKKKRRYQSDGYDLDLAYITPQLIAMGFPSDGLESYYRNPIGLVQKFLNEKHEGRYKVYNLCCERGYLAESFNGRVAVYGFKDHNAPPFALLARCMIDMDLWLSADSQRVAAVHCKAGKGRTGVIICCYLMVYDVRYRHADAALGYYGDQRTHNSKGVTIPSQNRYCHYFSRALAYGVLDSKLEREVQLVKIVVQSAPEKHSKDVRLSVMGFEIEGDIIQGDTVIYAFPELVAANDRKELVFDFPQPLTLTGDFDLAFEKRNKKKPFMHCWIHTAFIVSDVLTLTKSEIDGPHKDKKCSVYASDFQIQLHFILPPKTVSPPVPLLSPSADLSKVSRHWLPQYQGLGNSSVPALLNANIYVNMNETAEMYGAEAEESVVVNTTYTPIVSVPTTQVSSSSTTAVARGSFYHGDPNRGANVAVATSVYSSKVAEKFCCSESDSAVLTQADLAYKPMSCDVLPGSCPSVFLMKALANDSSDSAAEEEVVSPRERKVVFQGFEEYGSSDDDAYDS